MLLGNAAYLDLEIQVAGFAGLQGLAELHDLVSQRVAGLLDLGEPLVGRVGFHRLHGVQCDTHGQTDEDGLVMTFFVLGLHFVTNVQPELALRQFVLGVGLLVQQGFLRGEVDSHDGILQ